jgi:CubicO group peptidase (beta-lactamase class C family)
MLALIPAAAAQEGIDGTYDDPNGMFSMPIPTSWTAETTADGVALLSAPDNTVLVYALVVEAGDASDAVAAGWEQVGITIEPEPTPQEVPSSPGYDQTVLINYDTGTEPPAYQGFAQRIGTQNYLLLFVINDFAAASQRGAQLQIIASGFTPTELVAQDLSAVEPLAFADVQAEWEAFIQEWLPKSEVPGIAVAVVQDGEIVYTNAFGVRALGDDALLSPHTYMMIGSVGKSLTTLMMATEVDSGDITWDTPVVEVLPDFAVADPELTQTLTLRNLVCACTGVPRRDLEFIFNANELTAEDTVASLSTFQFFTAFGEAFQYSNQMVATGGYVGAAAISGDDADLFAAYVEALQTRVLDPIGMSRTTLDFDTVGSDFDYALPHSASFDETGAFYEPIPLASEGVLLPVAPAGAHWSTVIDMASYVQMLLQGGTAADGTQVVSADSLATLWQPQVAVSADTSYGLGWFVGDYFGLPLIYHGGNTLGFTADVALLPDQGIGVVVLVNGQGANILHEGIRTRLFELLFGVEDSAAVEGLEFLLAQAEELEPELIASVGVMDEATAAALVGTYTNDILGALVLTYADGVLMADVGEFSAEIRPAQGEDDEPNTYMTIDAPLAGQRLEHDPDAGTLTIDIVTDQYVFSRQS